MFFNRALIVKKIPGTGGEPQKEEARELYIRDAWRKRAESGGGWQVFGREHQDASDRLVTCDRVVYLS